MLIVFVVITLKKELIKYMKFLEELESRINIEELYIVDPTLERYLEEVTKELITKGYLLIIGRNDYGDSMISVFNDEKLLVTALYNYIVNGKTGHTFPIAITSVYIDSKKDLWEGYLYVQC